MMKIRISEILLLRLRFLMDVLRGQGLSSGAAQTEAVSGY